VPGHSTKAIVAVATLQASFGIRVRIVVVCDNLFSLSKGYVMWKYFFVLFCTASAVSSLAGSYQETFDTTLYRDVANTTADWDVSTGSLHLPAQHMGYLGGVSTTGATRVTAAGQLAVLVRGGAGVDLVDLTQPTLPVVVGSIVDTGFPGRFVTDAAISGTVLYLSWSKTASLFPPVTHHGILVYSIATPSAPVFVQSISTDPVNALVVHGNRLYLVGPVGLSIWDITDPVLPNPVASLALGGGLGGTPLALAVAGSRVYVAAGTTGLHLVILEPETAPVLAATLPLPGVAMDIAVDGALACVATGAAGVQLVDTTNPWAPIQIGSYAGAGSVASVAIAGDVLAVGGESGGVTQLDITDPAGPLLRDELMTSTGVEDLLLSGDRILTAESTGLGVIRAAAGYPPLSERVAPLDVFYLQHVTGMQAVGDRLYVGANGLVHVFDNSRTAPWAEFGPAFGNSSVLDFEVDGFVCHTINSWAGTRLDILDVSDPVSPVTLGSVVVGTASPRALDADGRIDCVLMKNSMQAARVAVVDVSDAIAPVVASTVILPPVPTYGGNYDLQRSGGNLIVLNDTAGLEIYNVSVPANIVTMGHYQPDAGRIAEAMAVDGSLLYVVSLDTLAITPYLEVVDLSVPASPSLLGSCAIGLHDNGVKNLVVTGSRLTFTGQYGLHTVDISDPAAPSMVHEMAYDLGRRGEGPLAVLGDHAYLPIDSSTQWVIDHTVNEYRLFSRGTNPTANVARSQSVANLVSNPLAIRLTPTVTGQFHWSYSLDGGTIFVAAVADGSWESVFPYQGTTLRWRAMLGQTPGGAAPICTDLEIDWRSAEPAVVSLTDVAPDQGGNLTLSFASSGAELINGYGGLVYTIYRQGAGASWDSVAVVPAVLGVASHTLTVPTVQDSTLWAGPQYSVFKVRAWGVPTAGFTDSAVDSAYSVDDLAPAPPMGVGIAYGATPLNSVRWTAGPDADVIMYRLHRGLVAGFPVSAATTIDSVAADSLPMAWIDQQHGDHLVHYAVTAVDTAGNESLPQHAVIISAVPPMLAPTRWVLGSASPNPFNPVTKISWGAPAGGGPVVVAVYDLAGRKVRTLLSGTVAAGPHEVTWDGTDASGRAVSSGVYLCRLQTPVGVLVRKMTLVE